MLKPTMFENEIFILIVLSNISTRSGKLSLKTIYKNIYLSFRPYIDPLFFYTFCRFCRNKRVAIDNNL